MGTFPRCSQSTAPHTPFFSGILGSWKIQMPGPFLIFSHVVSQEGNRSGSTAPIWHQRALGEGAHQQDTSRVQKNHTQILFHTSAYLNSGEGYKRLWKPGGQQQKYTKWGEKAWGIDSFQKQRLAHKVPCFWFTETGRVWERCVGKVLVRGHEFCAVTSGSKWDHISGRSVDGGFGAVL